ncbi:MAG: VWA domain-containing protein [Bdellovibrionales bacterium]|nr:VWA domain-containing protein [Bdellovibrionales bacterium]
MNKRNIFLSMSMLLLVACSDVNFTSIDSSVKPLCVQSPSAQSSDECVKMRLVNQSFSPPVGAQAVDILFVVDNSGSMKAQLLELGNRFPNFISSLAGLNWQICVTTTDVRADKQDGKLLSFSNGEKWINTQTTNAESKFLELLANMPTNGSGDERGILAINRALDRDEGCFRSGAALSTVVLSDEDERSTGGHDQASSQYRVLEPRDYASSVFETLSAKMWTQKVYSHHSIVIAPNDSQCLASQAAEGSASWYGTHYAELTKRTEGILGNICASDYGQQLSFIGQNIQDTIASVPLECDPYTASGLPIVMAEAAILKILPATTSKATLAGNKINFSPALAPGTTVTLKYYCPML